MLKKKRRKIAKMLACISFIATRDDGIDLDCLQKIIESTAEIAYEVGGIKMMNETQAYINYLFENA